MSDKSCCRNNPDCGGYDACCCNCKYQVVIKENYPDYHTIGYGCVGLAKTEPEYPDNFVCVHNDDLMGWKHGLCELYDKKE